MPSVSQFRIAHLRERVDLPRRRPPDGHLRHARVALVNVLAIDQGTSSTKALVVSDGGRVIGEANAPVHPKATGEGAVEQDPTELLQSIVDAGRAALAAARAPAD